MNCLLDQLKRFTQALQAISTTPRLDAELLWMVVLDCDRTYCYLWPERILTIAELAGGEALLQRRLRGEPIAYILGKQSFWNFELQVSPATLIPRPDTECLIEFMQNYFKVSGNKVVLELGTGSGAIILAIQQLWPHWQCVAVDLCRDALAIAQQNAKKYDLVQICFVHSDWFEQVRDRRFDIIVANPPYVSEDAIELAALNYEPRKALVSGAHGYADLKYIMQHAPDHLIDGGYLLLEHGAEQAFELLKFSEKIGLKCLYQGIDYKQTSRYLVFQYE